MATDDPWLGNSAPSMPPRGDIQVSVSNANLKLPLDKNVFDFNMAAPAVSLIAMASGWRSSSPVIDLAS